MYVWCRIKSRGFYLGKECPCDGLYITDEVYQILKATGLDIEIYDPEEEKRKKSMPAPRKEYVEPVEKKVEEVQPKVEEVTEKVEPKQEIVIEDEIVVEDSKGNIVDITPGEPTDVNDESSFIKNVKDELFAELQSNEDTIIDKELENYVSPQEEKYLAKKETVEEAVEEEKHTYTEEELNLLSRNELCQILFNLGHKGGRDPMAPKQKEKKDSIIRKILDCTSK